jgi:hypothetical protein
MDKSPLILSFAALCGIALTTSAIALMLALGSALLLAGGWARVLAAAASLLAAMAGTTLSAFLETD